MAFTGTYTCCVFNMVCRQLVGKEGNPQCGHGYRVAASRPIETVVYLLVGMNGQRRFARWSRHTHLILGVEHVIILFFY